MPRDLIATAATAPPLPWAARLNSRSADTDRTPATDRIARRTRMQSRQHPLPRNLALGTLIRTHRVVNFQTILTSDCRT